MGFYPSLMFWAAWYKRFICVAGYFTFWVILSLIWGLVATVIATLLPLWEARKALISVCMHLIGKGGLVNPKDHPPLEGYTGPEQFKEV